MDCMIYVENVVMMWRVVCVAAESIERVVPKSEFVEETTSFGKGGVASESVSVEKSEGAFCRACRLDVTVRAL